MAPPIRFSDSCTVSRLLAAADRNPFPRSTHLLSARVPFTLGAPGGPVPPPPPPPPPGGGWVGRPHRPGGGPPVAQCPPPPVGRLNCSWGHLRRFVVGGHGRRLADGNPPAEPVQDHPHQVA